ncbi:hypothetical protein [Terrabacter carboxydivorans]|uniref:Nucleotidyltransferase family protein n=1 Tax=Terrabacter carboxydivorans TaxID=619730 RepID=A0ABP5XX12_9MICO
MVDVSSRPARLAAELHRRGAQFVVVGSTARWLTAGGGSPRDLDVAVCPVDLPALARALDSLGVRTTVDRLARGGQSHVDTSWGPLDVFVDDALRCRVGTYARGGRTWQLAVLPA